MDWTYAIERHREPLIALVASLFAMIGLAEGGMLAQLKRPLYRKVLALLRPAEAAVRRLIVVAARGLKVEPPATRSTPARPANSSKSKGKGQSKGKVKGQSRPLFRLCDPPRRIGHGYGRPRPSRPRVEPRIHLLTPGPAAGSYIDVNTGLGLVPAFVRAQLGLAPVVFAPAAPPPKPEPDDSVNASRLCRRLAAIADALKDLPRQARRYARWKAKPVDQRRPKRDSALRFGPPPYLRRKSRHEVHDILRECHWLAREALKPDTS